MSSNCRGSDASVFQLLNKIVSTVSDPWMKPLRGLFDFGHPFSILYSAKHDGIAQKSIFSADKPVKIGKELEGNVRC